MSIVDQEINPTSSNVSTSSTQGGVKGNVNILDDNDEVVKEECVNKEFVEKERKIYD